MKLASVLLPFVLASTVTATPLPKRTSTCLTDAKANYFVQGFKSILTNPDREAANATAQVLVATGYVETSDSINSLAGYPLGGPTFVGKEGFANGVTYAPAIGKMTDLLIFHDCKNIAWHWVANGIGTGAQEVKGTNLFTVTEDGSQILLDVLEFNSVAWGIDDQQVTNTPPTIPTRK